MLTSIATGISKLTVGLKGSPTAKMSHSARHYLHDVNTPFAKATFGMGCFWSNDSLFGALQGVLRTRVGYSGGDSKNPTYRNIGDHVEVIEIDYDPTVLTYLDLLDQFWNHHEYGLTTKVKRQYMSLILYHTEEQKEIAEQSFYDEAKARGKPLITEIHKAGTFYPAEDYHQKYRLQGHKKLMESVGLKPGPMLQSSHLAARLNGYLVGLGGVDQFDDEADSLGLSKEQAAYVRNHLVTNEGNGLFC